MDLEILRQLCHTFPATTESIKWEHDLCFCVGEKMYLVTGIDEIPVSASFKASDEDFESLCNRGGFEPAPYLARYKWVYVDDIARLSKSEWEKLAAQAYHLVATKLPAKTRKAIGLA